MTCPRSPARRTLRMSALTPIKENFSFFISFYRLGAWSLRTVRVGVLWGRTCAESSFPCCVLLLAKKERERDLRFGGVLASGIIKPRPGGTSQLDQHALGIGSHDWLLFCVVGKRRADVLETKKPKLLLLGGEQGVVLLTGGD